MRKGVRREQYRAPAALLDRPARCLAELDHLGLAHLIGKIVRRIVTGNAYDWNVPFRIHHVARHDRPVVDAEVRVAHHLRDQPVRPPLLGDHLRQLDVDFDVVLESKKIREDWIDRKAVKLGNSQEVMADDGLPVRRMHEQDVGLLLQKVFSRALVAPAQHFPAAFRARLIAPMILAIHDVGWVGGEDAADDFAFAHSFTVVSSRA